MSNILALLSIVCFGVSLTSSHPYFNPFIKLYSYSYPPTSYYQSHSNYANHVPITTYPIQYTQPIYQPQTQQAQQAPYVSHLSELPTINILSATAYTIDKTFTVVPMLVVPSDNLNMISDAQIVTVSKKKPTVTIKTNNKDLINCTPAVRIVLDTPIVIYSLKTSIIFPSQISIVHDRVRIPIRVGAVIAPVAQDTYISEETPVSINIVYAIPTKPIQVDYVNNDQDVIVDNNSQSVSVENHENVTLVEDDESELVNRNPPSAPAGIVQSTQPGQAHLEIFSNPKESAVLTALREESKKKRI